MVRTSVVFALLSLLAASIRAYPTGPDPAVTGGFGERTCAGAGCHSTYELDEGKTAKLGDILIEGLPGQYEPGKTYPIKLVNSHTQDRRHWGFQLAARAKATGAQAGELSTIDGTTQILTEKGIQYIEHTEQGITSNTFQFTWTAPSAPAGEVVMHASGNAADGDGSPEGDYIYSTSVAVSPAK
ncbi:MAG: hypothetical protein A3H29_02370 [Acidobacteria bacterium RIFCSPLOWO2_02_FULL_67_21]|nr:MAG: hypothetical protein A3H29_02370 [Acidobacteria bacterium RIFCSPLOWO2_02_FULL_67_21]